MITTVHEQYANVGRGITLCFEQIGDPNDRPLLLLPGLGQQLISWPRQLCDQFVERGLRVIRIDNRDSGRSTHLQAKPPSLVATLTGRFPPGTYNLRDMARDTRGLMDALGIERADLVGASMGGMIAQVVASRYPERVRSLTSLFSTTGAPRLGRPALSTWMRMAAPPPRSASAAARAEVRMYRHIGSHGYLFDAASVTEHALAAWQRDPTSDGAARQLAAILASGDRTGELANVVAPTLVIHGDRDRMVATSGGHATHRAIRGSQLWVVPGMGHDYPQNLWATLAERVSGHVAAADHAAASGEDRPARSHKDAAGGAQARGGKGPDVPERTAGAEPRKAHAVSAAITSTVREGE
jgi:pimeloyl-ACP methyl ester carboxylesterase